jgi:hypothetical protein
VAELHRDRRPFKSATSTMANKLPTEIWSMIIEQIRQSDEVEAEDKKLGYIYPLLPPEIILSPTLKSLLYTSQFFHDLAIPLFISNIDWAYPMSELRRPPSKHSSFVDLVRDPKRSNLIQHIYYRQVVFPSLDIKPIFLGTLARLNNLRSLSVSRIPVTSRFLEAVAALPQLLDLHFIGCTDDITSNAVGGGGPIPLSRSLERIGIVRSESDDYGHPPLALLRSPKLKALQMCYHYAPTVFSHLLSESQPIALAELMVPVLSNDLPVFLNFITVYGYSLQSITFTLPTTKYMRNHTGAPLDTLPNLKCYRGPTIFAAALCSGGKITELFLEYGTYALQDVQVLSECFKSIGAQCSKSLSHLEFSTKAMRDDFFVAIADTFPNLQQLHMHMSLHTLGEVSR